MQRLKHLTILAALLATIVLGVAEPSDAQLAWRVSVKFILDAGNNRPTAGIIITDADVQAQIDIANEILDAGGRGYRLSLLEIVDVAGVSGWFNAPINTATRDGLEAAAKANTATYAWRTSRINVYINGNSGSAICSFPPSREIIVMGQGSRSTTMFHEIGHFFDLCHTQGCPCGSCPGDGSTTCNTVPGDDEIDDTIGDLACWSRNQIAQWTYGTIYLFLTDSQKSRVNDVFNNIMSYHNSRDRLTEDQYDRATCISNGVRYHVASGRTRIVGTQSGQEECQDPAYLHSTFGSALTAANTGDIILMRGSLYPYAGTVTKSVTLRSSRGNSLLGTAARTDLPPDEEPVEPWGPKLPDTDDGRTGP